MWILGVIFIIFLAGYTIEHFIVEHKFRKFKSQLEIGTKLRLLMKDDSDEFDEGYEFNVSIFRMGVKQVKIEYSDGSIRNKDIRRLFEEGWQIVKEEDGFDL